MEYGDFKRIRQIARKTKCGVKLDEKKGLPFLLRKYQKRKVFLILLACVGISIFALSQFIWNIEVEGNETIPTEEILTLAKECGLEQGTLKTKINQNEFTNRMRMERDDLAWVGVECKGTNLTIRIVEAEKKPEMIPSDEYCQIVATKEGAIQRIQAQNGTICVSVGDLVKPGDVLIAGTMEGKYTGVRQVHAQGEVWARVWYSKKGRFYFQQEKKNRTGREEKKYEIKINNFQINLYKTLSKFEKYDTIKENKKCKIFSNFYLPLELTTIQNYEYVTEEVTLRD